MAVELPPLALLSGMLCFEHLLALQEKLNAYIAFIESGDIYTEIPGALGKSPIIRIIGKYELSEQGELLVDRATLRNDWSPRRHRLDLLSRRRVKRISRRRYSYCKGMAGCSRPTGL
jgi:hypothetical protein